jgi:hypothetical protein
VHRPFGRLSYATRKLCLHARFGHTTIEKDIPEIECEHSAMSSMSPLRARVLDKNSLLDDD